MAMRIKAFVCVLLCGVLLLLVNAGARSALEWQRDQASAAIYQRALGSVPAASGLTIPELMSNPDYKARLQEANREVSDEYRWYLYAVWLIKTLLFLLLAAACSQTILGMARRQSVASGG